MVVPGLTPHEALETVIDALGIQRNLKPEVGTRRRIEITWRYARNRRRDLRKADGLADDGGIASEHVLPDAVRDDDRWRSVVRGWRLGEAAEGHRQAEHLEKPFADGICTRFDRRAIVLQERDIVALQAGGADDRQAGIVQPDDLDRRQVAGGDAAIGERRPQRVEIARVRVGQRLQQRSVDGAEDGRRGGNADRERADRREGKRRRPAQRAQRKSKILEEYAHPPLQVVRISRNQ